MGLKYFTFAITGKYQKRTTHVSYIQHTRCFPMKVLCAMLYLLYFSSNLRNKSLSQLTPLSPLEAKSTVVSNVRFQKVFVYNFVYFTFKW